MLRSFRASSPSHSWVKSCCGQMPQCSSRRTAEQPLSRSSAVRSRSGPFSARETARRAACVSPCGRTSDGAPRPCRRRTAAAISGPVRPAQCSSRPSAPWGCMASASSRCSVPTQACPSRAASAHASRSAAESSGGRSCFAKSLPPLNIGILARLCPVQTRRKKFAFPNFPIAFSQKHDKMGILLVIGGDTHGIQDHRQLPEVRNLRWRVPDECDL